MDDPIHNLCLMVGALQGQFADFVAERRERDQTVDADAAKRHNENVAHISNVEHDVKNVRGSVTDLAARVVKIESTTKRIEGPLLAFGTIRKRSKWLALGIVSVLFFVGEAVHNGMAIWEGVMKLARTLVKWEG